jgi:acyl carrier protein
MDRVEIARKLVELIRPYTTNQAPLETLDEDAELVNHLHINSMHLIDVVLEVEECFDIEITSDEAGALSRVGTILDLIQSKVSDRVASAGAAQ